MARVIAEREYAVLVEDEPFDGRIFLEHFCGFFCKREARHHVRYKAEAIAESLRAQCIASSLIDQAEDRGRMCVVDKFVRNKRVQQSFHGRIRRLRIDKRRALHPNHLFVRHGRARAELAQCCKPHGRHSGRFDAGHVPAGAFDGEDIDILAKKVVETRLHRSVATSVQDQPWLAAKQAGRIDTQRQVRANASLRPMIESRLGVAVDPGGFHRRLPLVA